MPLLPKVLDGNAAGLLVRHDPPRRQLAIRRDAAVPVLDRIEPRAAAEELAQRAPDRGLAVEGRLEHGGTQHLRGILRIDLDFERADRVIAGRQIDRQFRSRLDLCLLAACCSAGHVPQSIEHFGRLLQAGRQPLRNRPS